MRSAGLTRFLHSHESRLLLATVALAAFLSAATRGFATLQNALDLLTSNAFTGVLAAGLLVVLVAGGIDISFTASASIAQYAAMSLANRYPIGWLGVFAIGVGIGTALGLLNAVLISTLRISSIIVSVAMLNVFFGLLMFVTRGNEIYALPQWFADGVNWVFYTDAQQVDYAVNLQMLALPAMFLLTWWLLNRTSVGRQVYAMGGNPEAAQRIGFHVFRLNLLAYGYLGFAAGVGSLLQAQLAQSVAPNVLVGRELDVLAAVVLGGASLTGGVGTVFGTMLGVALLAIMQNGMVLLGVSSYWSGLFTGLVILVAVCAIALERRQSRARARRVMA